MSVSTIDRVGGLRVGRAWVVRALAVTVLAAVIVAGVVIGRAATASPGVHKPATPAPPAVEQVVPRAPDLPGYVGLPKGMDGP